MRGAPGAAAVLLLTLLVSGLHGAPDTCRTTFDAVARIRGELFFFKDHYFWRRDVRGHLMTPEPVEVDTFWGGLPARASVDAVYERPDGSVVFFCGRYFWVFWDRHALTGYPRPLSDLGLPEETPSVDAAFVSGHTQGTYLITGGQYWRFNELTETVEADSPLPISRLCRGLPRKLDAAFTDADGQTFFVQGRHYWRCDSPRAQVRSYAPDLVAPRWLGCSLAQCCLENVDDHIDTEVLWSGARSGNLRNATGPLAAVARGLLVVALVAVWVGSTRLTGSL
ncbi:matrix metalloproteinase-17-like [Pollicipes pollicipes]|uniref:matrix metalloproteinase-17-like n=1 Tax=Pollicipes pollicipes TaxID=41117 RepID=UPI0018858233|nr:matrix metalloproteinase-17-like [Pollicipes pollicipes]XP_037074357.1 matrix metalloproteinase-17-like [Pollicipes pollicipes]